MGPVEQKKSTRLREYLTVCSLKREFERTLVFVTSDLDPVLIREWRPDDPAHTRDTMVDARELGAAGYFLGLYRTSGSQEQRGAIENLRLLGEHLDLTLIEVLRW